MLGLMSKLKVMNKIDLTDCTFIIPIMLESDDRKKNFEITLKYLTTHLNTSIIVFEYGSYKIGESLLPTDSKGIDYRFFEINTDIFHRTKCINEMLNIVRTSVVVNYDVDVLLAPQAYKECYDKAMISDMVFAGRQYSVNYSGRNKLAESMSLDALNSDDIAGIYDGCGHVIFFKTQSYIEGGMENENFIGWGLEDLERVYRFEKLGYKIEHAAAHNIYHIEHSRGINSNNSNPYFDNNVRLIDYLKSLTVEQLREYYSLKKHINKNTEYKYVPSSGSMSKINSSIWGGR